MPKQTRSITLVNRSGYVINSSLRPITDFTDERVDSSTKRALTRTDFASQYGLCTTLPPLHPRESLWVEVSATRTAFCDVLRLTSVPAVRPPFQIRKQTKTKHGSWKTVPLPVTGSVAIGEPRVSRSRLLDSIPP